VESLGSAVEVSSELETLPQLWHSAIARSLVDCGESEPGESPSCVGYQPERSAGWNLPSPYQ
jgi:hypothetical protein